MSTQEQLPTSVDDVRTALALLRYGQFAGYETDLFKKPDGTYEIVASKVADWPEQVEDMKHIPLATAVFEELEHGELIRQGRYHPESGETYSWCLSSKGIEEAKSN